MLSQVVNENKSVEILYVQDALCGWCYGLAPVIEQIRAHYKDDVLTLTPVHGGLWPGKRAKKMDHALVSHLRNGMPKVTEYTGQVFGDDFKKNIVDNPQFLYDTEPAARAAIIVRSLSPDNELAFIKDIQIAFFVNGLDTNKLETFLSIVSQYGIDEGEFEKSYSSKQSKDETQNDFVRCASWGISAFPSLLLKTNGKINMISAGSCSLDHIINIVDQALGLK